MRRHLLLAMLLIGFQCLIGAPLKNIPVQLQQPNGTTVHCFASGDEYYNYLHDANGFTIVQGKDGYYVYAIKDTEGTVIPSSFVVGEVDPASVGLQPYMLISEQEYYARRKEFTQHVKQPARPRDGEINHGRINNLVVFIRFAGDTYHNTPFSAVDSMFNAPSYNTVSMRNYFHHASYNQLDLVSFFVPQPDSETILSYEDIHPKQYYQPYNPQTNPIGYLDEERVEREFSLLERAIGYIEDMVPDSIDLDYNDDGLVDNVVFVVKGEPGAWNSLLWPHRWSIYDRYVPLGDLQVFDFNLQLEIGDYFTVGVLCHEMNHSLSAPDLYHYNESNFDPAGAWDLMCSNTNPPQYTTAYMKYKYGHWIDEIPDITDQFGTYELESLSWEGNRRNAYKIRTNDPNEYFVLEYRNSHQLFDKGVPGTGLLIYRIDTRFYGGADYNGYDVFDEVYIFRPGGTVYNNGSINGANYNDQYGRTEFHAGTNPEPFLTNGQYLNWEKQICEIQYLGDRMRFTYRPYGGECSAPGPENLIVNVNREAHQVELSWDPDEDADSYVITCDGISIGSQSTETSFVFPYTEADEGYHVFGVASLSGGVANVLSAESQEWAILGGFETIDVDILSESNDGTKGGELEVSFDNPMMKTQYFTIYKGTQAAGKVYVPSNTEVTFRWVAGFDHESHGIVVRGKTTNQNGQSLLFQTDDPAEGVIATYTVPEGRMGIMSPQHLTAFSDGADVQLRWALPVEADHFVVYRDERQIATDLVGREYLDETVLRSGGHKYRVESSNGNATSLDLDNHVYALVLNDYCEPPRNLHGTHHDNGVNALEWEAPAFVGHGLLAYDSDGFLQGFGDKNQKWGIKFMPEQLARFEGRPLTHLEIFDIVEGIHTFKIYNGETTSNSNLLYTEERQLTGSMSWVRFELNEEVTYDPNLPLWICVDSPNIESPIPSGAYTGDDNGCMAKAGNNWKPVTYYGFYHTWLLRAYTRPLEGVNEFTYRLYRGEEDCLDDQMELLLDGLTTTSATHASNDDLRYNVTAVWNGKETDFSNNLFLGPSVSVDEVTVEDAVKLFPNPTHGTLTIQGVGLRRISVYNVTGQLLHDYAMATDEVKIDLGQYGSGIFLIQLLTESEVIVRKVTVME